MRIIAFLCASLLVYHPALKGQTSFDSLQITVLKGMDGRNSIKSRIGIPIEIEVRDNQGKSVAGAQIIFTLPSFGASGSFPGGQLTARTTSGPDGHAVMSGFVPNDIEGRFNIKVTADSGTLSGAAVVPEVNVAMLESDKPKSHKSLWILLAVGAAGGIAAGVLGGGKGGSTPAPAPVPPVVTVTPGAVSVGGPR